jgi:hypothetical protein
MIHIDLYLVGTIYQKKYFVGTCCHGVTCLTLGNQSPTEPPLWPTTLHSLFILNKLNLIDNHNHNNTFQIVKFELQPSP